MASVAGASGEQAGGVELALALTDFLVAAKEQVSVLGVKVVEEFVGTDRALRVLLALIARCKDILGGGASTLLWRGVLPGAFQLHLSVCSWRSAQQVVELAQSLHMRGTRRPGG